MSGTDHKCIASWPTEVLRMPPLGSPPGRSRTVNPSNPWWTKLKEILRDEYCLYDVRGGAVGGGSSVAARRWTFTIKYHHVKSWKSFGFRYSAAHGPRIWSHASQNTRPACWSDGFANCRKPKWDLNANHQPQRKPAQSQARKSTALSWNKMVKITTGKKQLPVKIKDINSRGREREWTERLTIELF